MGKGCLITLIVLGVLVVIGLGSIFSFYSYTNSLRNQMIAYETQLTAQYLSNQNYLSEFISGFYESIGVANLKSDKMDKILTDAVKGRYGEKGFSAQGGFFSAVKEAYPDIANSMAVYDKIVDYVQSRRAGYRDIQDKLLDMLAVYKRWKESGWVQSFIIANLLKAPSDNLQARIGTDVLSGQKALDKMYQIVLTEQAANAYQTGKMAPLAVPKN